MIRQKLKQYTFKLLRANKIHLAEDMLSLNPSDTNEAIEEFIKKSIGIPKHSSKIDQIREIKKLPLYPKDEVRIKILWWEAKRDALRDKMQRLNLELPTNRQHSFLAKVIDELNSRITKNIKLYKDFPDSEASLDIELLFKVAMTTGTFYSSTDPGWYSAMKKISGTPFLQLDESLENIFKTWNDFSHKYIKEYDELTIEGLEEMYNFISTSFDKTSKYYNQIESQVNLMKTLLEDLKVIKNRVERDDVFAIETLAKRYKDGNEIKFEPQKLKFMDKEVEKHLKEIRNTDKLALWLTGEGKYREMAEKLK